MCPFCLPTLTLGSHVCEGINYQLFQKDVNKELLWTVKVGIEIKYFCTFIFYLNVFYLDENVAV